MFLLSSSTDIDFCWANNIGCRSSFAKRIARDRPWNSGRDKSTKKKEKKVALRREATKTKKIKKKKKGLYSKRSALREFRFI